MTTDELATRAAAQTTARMHETADLMDALASAVRTQVTALERENMQLRHVLQALYDEQHDAPLERRRAIWEQVMRDVQHVLDPHSGHGV